LSTTRGLPRRRLLATLAGAGAATLPLAGNASAAPVIAAASDLQFALE
jgi:hypothetical protein